MWQSEHKWKPEFPNDPNADQGASGSQKSEVTEVTGSCQRLPEVARGYQKLLEVAGSGQRLHRYNRCGHVFTKGMILMMSEPTITVRGTPISGPLRPSDPSGRLALPAPSGRPVPSSRPVPPDTAPYLPATISHPPVTPNGMPPATRPRPSVDPLGHMSTS